MKNLTKQQNSFVILKYAAFLIVFFLFFNAKILGEINPFPFAFLFSLVWCGQNVFLLSACYVLGSLALGISYAFLLPTVFTVLILILCALIYKKANKKVSLFFLNLIAFLSQLGRFIPYNSLDILFKNFCEIGIGIVLLNCFCVAFGAFLQRKQKIKFNADETFCAAVFLVGLFCAISSLKFSTVNVGFVLCVFLMLVCMNAFGGAKTLVFTSCAGVGMFLATNSLMFLASVVLSCLFAGVFSGINKYFSCVSLLVCEALLGFYLKIYPAYSVYNFVAVCLACASFLFISNKTIKGLKRIFTGSAFEENEKALIEVSRKMQYMKLNEISKVFDEINGQYKTMLKSTLSSEEASFMLAQELCLRCCEDCPNKNVCFRKSGEDVTSMFYKMFGTGIIKKQIGLINIPNALYARCTKSKQLLADANSLLEQYLQYDKNICELNTSKKIISNQMASVSKAIKKIAANYSSSLNFDHDLENTMTQQLIYCNETGASDVIVFKENDNFNVLISFLKEPDNKGIIEKIVSEACNIKMEINDIIKNDEGGASFYLINSPKCDLVFATASVGGSGDVQNGDLHSLLKLSSGKYMLGICDGMGIGKTANKISNKTLNLIESYYRAGFESEEIISSVNGILLSQNTETCSALDICVLDLNHLEADFIKLGAPNTFIKRKDRTEVVNFGTLPIGAVEEIKPKLEKRLVEPKDVIFMLSDGVSDCFENENDLAGVINSLKGNNPEELANLLLNKALEKNMGQAKDDMTVFVSRIFRKV